ncbi:hypothetical protein [Thiolapillus sp.]|uniref:hypothetical protein n=3 Tax=Thiolapillus sp. TaxID=2017437 RepID=UPI003AF427A1
MTRTAGAQIGCQRPSRFWGLGCPKIYHEAEDTLVQSLIASESGLVLQLSVAFHGPDVIAIEEPVDLLPGQPLPAMESEAKAGSPQ